MTSLLAFLSSLRFTREHGFSFLRLDGTMSQKKRTQVIQEFQSSAANSPAILLLSLKAGGVGLNLNAASRVFLMEPVSTDFGQESDTFTRTTTDYIMYHVEGNLHEATYKRKRTEAGQKSRSSISQPHMPYVTIV